MKLGERESCELIVCSYYLAGMPLYTVYVKWGKEKFDNVELNTYEPPMVFKDQLFALTVVQPDRQKVTVKGGTLKDDDWGSLKIKNGMSLLMMGSAEALPGERTVRPVFVEDMTEEQLASAMELPCSLTNLGNVCYMNATVQCIRSVPELKEALKRYMGALRASEEMTSAHLRSTLLQLSVICMNLWTRLHPVSLPLSSSSSCTWPSRSLQKKANRDNICSRMPMHVEYK